MISPSLSILLVTLMLFLTNSTNFTSIGHCLGNCAICQINQLDTCSGQQFIDCDKGYSGVNCTIKQSYAGQILLMNSNTPNQNISWKDNSSISCTYTNSNFQLITINVLGLYSFIGGNSIQLDILPYYENFILSFNIIRENWNQFTDSITVTITDQNQNIISNDIITTSTKDNMSIILNPLQCNKKTYIIQKYQIQGILNPQINKKIIISLDGIISSGTSWGITNAKFISGCTNMLVFDGNDCQKCADGYYPLRYPNKTIEACSVCSLNCLICTDALVCSTCLQGFVLLNGQCSNNNTFAMISTTPTTPTICQNLSLFSSNTIGQQQSLTMELNYFLPLHQNQSRIYFYLAYSPSQFSNSDKITIQIDNNLEIIQILGSDLNLQGSKPKQICSNFGTQGYFSLYKVVSNYFQHNSAKINMTISVNQPRTIEILYVGFQYQPLSTTSILSPIIMPILPQIIPPNMTLNISPIIFSAFPVVPSIPTPVIDINNKIFENPFSNALNLNATTIFIQYAIQQLQQIKQNVKIGIKQSQQLMITIRYPKAFLKFPQYVAHLIKTNQTISSIVNKQTFQYQELVLNLTSSIRNQEIQLYMFEENPMLIYGDLYSGLSNGTILAKAQINRYDQLSHGQISSYQKFGDFFEVMSWIAIISTLILSIFGHGVLTYKFYSLLQIVFLHVYIYTQYIPTNFKVIVGGLYRMQNFNYFAKSSSEAIEKFLLGNVLQLSPAKFTIFTKDINFSRAIYPSLIAIFIYLACFGILNGIRKVVKKSVEFQQPDQQLSILDKIKRFIYTISSRFLNFWYQVWQYLYLTFVFSVFVQFFNLSYPQNSNRSAVLNGIFCFACLLIALALPILTYFYLNSKFKNMEYSDYTYWYEGIFFQKLPTQSLPSNHHRIYILVHNFRYILLAICFAFLGNYPIGALLVLITIHAVNFFYQRYAKIQILFINQIFTIIEHALLIILAFLLIIAYLVSSTVSTSHYMGLGFIMVTICLLLVLLGLVTFGYNIFYKIKEKSISEDLSDFKPTVGTQRGT